MAPVEDKKPVSDNLSLMSNALPNRLEALESASDVLAAVLESLKESCPECVIEKVLDSSRKSVVLLGDCRGIPCVVKCMVGADSYWALRFRHEQRIYQMFDSVPPHFDVPKLLHIDERNFITVVSRIEGTALREGRYFTVPLESQHVEPLILMFASLGSYVTPDQPKDSVVYEQLGDRFERYSKLGLIRPNDVALLRILSTLGVSPVFGHGDPLPSNVLFMDSKYCLIDWEFGDFFLPGYDLAGLHTFALEDPKLQHSIIDFVTAQGPDFTKSFMLNLVNILSREVRTHSELPDESEAKHRLSKLEVRLQETRNVIDTLI